DDDGTDGGLRAIAGCPVHAHRGADTATAGYRCGWRHADDAAAQPLLDAGAVQLLRPPRTRWRRGAVGPLERLGGCGSGSCRSDWQSVPRPNATPTSTA